MTFLKGTMFPRKEAKETPQEEQVALAERIPADIKLLKKAELLLEQQGKLPLPLSEGKTGKGSHSSHSQLDSAFQFFPTWGGASTLQDTSQLT